MVDGYQLLANAVVEQAAEDYRKALVEQHELRPVQPIKKENEQTELLEILNVGLPET